ncbi:MAG: hypothetical protein RIA64_10815 [Rhodospirillales bacterium]
MSTSSSRRYRHRIGGPAAVLIFLGATAGTLFAGMVLSHQSDDWSWFSRAGSLLVVLGIVFAYFNVDGFIERSLRMAVTRLSRYDRDNPSNTADWIVSWLSEEPEDISGTVKALEVCVIVIGTLVWGFGDLLGP